MIMGKFQILNIFIILLMVGMLFGGGYLCAMVIAKPEIIYKPYPLPQPYIIVVKSPPIERILEVPQKLREFSNCEELRAWLPPVRYIPGGDCDDYAFRLVKLAREAGYMMETELVGIWDEEPCHAICKTYIGNEVYFIEPQDNEVWLWGYID